MAQSLTNSDLRYRDVVFEDQPAEELTGAGLAGVRARPDEAGARRERALQILLNSARWLRSDLAEREIMTRICQAALEVLTDEAEAAGIVIHKENRLAIMGHCGFPGNKPVEGHWAFENSFAALVIEQGRTAYIKDLAKRPDIQIPQPATGGPFRSLLASPLRVQERIVGVVEVYCRRVRQWSAESFRVIDWLSQQASLVLETIELEQELQQRRREAEEASIRKTRFLAAVSHDVRTPANAIHLMAELIARSAENPAAVAEIPALARDLQANARSLVELVSDVLDLARFDSGRVDLQRTNFCLGEMLQAEIRQLQPIASAHGIRLDLDADPAIWLYTDRMKLSRVMANLVGNAIKFTEQGSVCVEARRDKGGVRIRVTDTGIGIPAEHVPHIFDEFFQLRNPARNHTKGTGLGLAICRRLLDALGARIKVDSTLGQGSTFTIELPAAIVIDSPARCDLEVKETRPATAGGPLAGVYVLLVEDHDTTRRATAQFLASEGAIVVEAASGRAAIHAITHESPQVILLDLMLPDIDGTEVLRFLQDRRPTMLKCIFVISGDVRTARSEEAIALGADAIIAKPINIQSLVGQIQAALSSSYPRSLLEMSNGR